METEILGLSIQGDGIAEGPLYVPYALPGEVVSGTVSGNRMEGVKILRPSAERVKAPCPHFRSCGGCALQHASDGFLAEWKTGVVRKALAAQGLAAEFRETVTSPAGSRRRAGFTGRRTKKGAMVGFHARGSDLLLAIPSCVLLHPDIMAAMPLYEALTKIGATRKVAVEIAVTLSLEGLDVAVSNAVPADGPMLAELGQLVGTSGIARLSWNGEVIATRTPPVQRFGSAQVVPPPGAFLQATQAGQDALTAAVLEAVGDARNVADLFSGCGTFTLPLAERADVLALEGDSALIAALDAGWRKGTGLHRVVAQKRDLFRNPLLAEDMRGLDAIVIDPPRAGAKAQVAELAASDMGRVAFVSCNPVTFARDAKVLVAAGFGIDWLQVVDQFRWSTHVELVAAFSRQVSAAI